MAYFPPNSRGTSRSIRRFGIEDHDWFYEHRGVFTGRKSPCDIV
jgi:hypothetical protein